MKKFDLLAGLMPVRPGNDALLDDGAATRRQVVLLWAFAALLLVLFGLLGVWKALDEHALEQRAVDQANANLAKSLQAHSLSILASAEQVVRFVKARYEERGDKVDLGALVKKGEVDDRHFNQIGIINAQGLYVASNLTNFSRVDLSDREHFRVHLDNDLQGRVFVSKPVKGRVSGKWSIQLTGRINKPDGTFGGVVVVSVDPQTFTQVYADVDVGTAGLIELVGDDGIIRVRSGQGEDKTGAQIDVARSPLYKAFASGQSGLLASVSEFDEVERRLAWRKVPGYPLTVVVGQSVDEALIDYRQRMRGYFLFYLVLATIVIGFTIGATGMLTRLHQNMVELERSRALAEDANTAKTMFLANMSHELRTPLTSILGYAEALREEDTYGPLREGQKRGLQRIEESGMHLLSLVSDVLDMIKLQGGKLIPEIGKVEPERVGRACLQVIEAAAARKAIALEVSIAPRLPEFQADERWVRQILLNLLSNAVKFTPDHGRIGLEVTLHRGRMLFTVWDSGIGISADGIAKLFQPFVQLDAGLDRKNDGTGLGLALSQGLAERLGGGITVQSIPGAGSRFVLVLPLAQPAGVPA